MDIKRSNQGAGQLVGETAESGQQRYPGRFSRRDFEAIAERAVLREPGQEPGREGAARAEALGMALDAGVRIDGRRLWDSLMELAKIGATPKGGVCRLALTDLDKAARDLIIDWGRRPAARSRSTRWATSSCAAAGATTRWRRC